MSDLGRLVFVTTELDPVIPGGAGTVVDLLARDLVDERPVTVVLVVDAPLDTPVDVPYDLHIEVADLPPGDDPAAVRHRFLARSSAAARAVRDVVASGGVTRVEVQDFDGLAYRLLLHREDAGVTDVAVSVRWHGPVLAMAAATGVRHPEWDTVEAMELGAVLMADAVVAPSEAVAEDIAERTGVPRSRIVVGPPPVPGVARLERVPAPLPEFVAVGRLGEVKGSHDLVAAATAALPDLPGARLRFVGADGWSVTAGRPMRAWLEQLIPVGLRDRVTFEPAVPRGELPELLASAWAVVVPSRYESFCLAAHEARAMGLPVIVPDLPAFRDLLHDGTGAVVYDGSVDGLAGAMRRVGSDRLITNALGRRPLPAYGDPLSSYRGDPLRPRHAREQAGVATAAGKRVEQTLNSRTGRPSLARGAAAAVMRHLPEGAARAAVRVVPPSLKNRFRDVVSWPEEVARRDRESRWADVRERCASGEVAELDAPDVTVVIPVHNQGGFLRDAIASVFAQTHVSWEIVVVDDGSDDAETPAALAGLDLPRVRILRQENRGLSAARNAGMAIARGRYLVPLDADDELGPAFLERLLGELEAHPDAAYAHCWAELFGDVDALWVSRPFNRYQLLLSNSVVGCVLLRRSAWEQVGGYDERLRTGNEDWDLWVRLDAAGFGQVEVHDVLFRYRKHGVSMSVTTEARFEQARLELAQRHPQLYEQAAIRQRKEAYPWVSVVVSATSDLESLRHQDLDDVEVVTRGLASEYVSDLVRERAWRLRVVDPDDTGVLTLSRGKFVIDWDRIVSAAPSALRALAEHLERAPAASGAAPEPAGSEPVLWRRWSLLDRAGPDGAPIVVPAELTVRPGRWRVGLLPMPGWDVSRDLADPARVQRQRPEEEGPIPAWIQELWRAGT